MSSLALQLISDIHVDHHRDGGDEFLAKLPVAADVLVVAGDVAGFRHFTQVRKIFDKLCANRRKVFYVPGNHEYYGSSPLEVDSLIRKLEEAFPNLCVLRPGKVETLDGHRILGATLWFRDDPMNGLYAPNLNDFSQIKRFVPWVYKENTETLKFLEAELKPNDIVVTHHMPAPQSVHPQYAGDQLNRFFLCDVEALIRVRQPQLWMHGHTHTQFDYYIDKCRVVANPLGYPRESSNVGFNDKLVLTAKE